MNNHPSFDGYIEEDSFNYEESPFNPEDYEFQAPVTEAPAPVAPRLTLEDSIKDAFLQVVAASHGRTSDEALELAMQVSKSEQALGALSKESAKLVNTVCEIIRNEAASLTSGTFDLGNMPTLVVYEGNPAVAAFVESAIALASTGNVVSNPSAVWMAASELVARDRAGVSAKRLLDSINSGATTEELMVRFQNISAPTARKGTVRTRGVRSAAEVAEDAAAVAAASTPMRFSSGYRTLDTWVTNPTGTDPMGFIAPGEGVVIAAGTGQGKSSFSYGLVPALAQDLRNWGFEDAKVYFAHTEEASEDKVKAMRLGPGQRFHHLSNQVAVADVGSSTEAFVMGIYDLVIDAYEMATVTGRDIVEFIPHIVVLDYIQALSSEKDKNEVEATRATAELILRGVQGWNPEEMRKFSGVDFTTYAGMAWPKGMENHRVATICFAQLVKAAGDKGAYKPGSRNCELSDYVTLDANGEPLWTPQEGDQPILGKDAIRGSGVILQNATFIIFLHRSNIHAGKQTYSDGRVHLTDTRARLVIDKMRNGAISPVVPMMFDSQVSGFRGQYFDPHAEAALAEGRFECDEAFVETGDPLLPVRPASRPLGAARY